MPPELAPRRNVELKARDHDLAGSLVVCRALGAEDHGEIRQRDTYFNVASGGLKLREESPGQAHLIQFERSHEPQQRESRYRIVVIEDGPALRAVLDAALGVKVVVAKRRVCMCGARSGSISTRSAGWERSSSLKPSRGRSLISRVSTLWSGSSARPSRSRMRDCSRAATPTSCWAAPRRQQPLLRGNGICDR